MEYGKSFLHTSILCIGCAVLQVASSAVIGYGFARFRFPCRGLLFGLVILTIVVPTSLTFIPMMMQYRFFNWFGLEPVLASISPRRQKRSEAHEKESCIHHRQAAPGLCRRSVL